MLSSRYRADVPYSHRFSITDYYEKDSCTVSHRHSCGICNDLRAVEKVNTLRFSWSLASLRSWFDSGGSEECSTNIYDLGIAFELFPIMHSINVAYGSRDDLMADEKAIDEGRRLKAAAVRQDIA